LVQILGALQ